MGSPPDYSMWLMGNEIRLRGGSSCLPPEGRPSSSRVGYQWYPQDRAAMRQVETRVSSYLVAPV